MKNYTLILCLVSFFVLSIASDAEKKEKAPVEDKVKKSEELRERLGRQLNWFEPANVIFSKPGKTDLSQTENEARFLKFSQPVGGSSVSQHDLFFNILTTAVRDIHEVCEAIADKFERFVIEDEGNLMAIRLGNDRLNQMLNDFAATATSRANAAASSALALSAGGGGAGGGGLLGGLLGGGGGGLLGGLGLGKK